ncbi:helix-turn-helix transcriptional regulator [Qipengyuania sp. CAU 1752]
MRIDPGIDHSLKKMFLGARNYALDHGVQSASYRIVPPLHSQLHEDAILIHYGFPDEWIALYDDDPEFRQHDPIADFVISAGKVMSWSEAIEAQTLSPEQEAFVAAMHEHGLIHGIAAPIYGPRGSEAYFTFSLGREITDIDAPLVEELITFATTMHRRITNLAETRADDVPQFSKREKEVLVWIARGKSNLDISTILGVSNATVGTYVSRIFQKLGVNGRMAATIKGLQLGIFRL